MPLKKQPEKIKKALEYLVILAGTIIYALAVVIFIRPSSIPLGGVTGIALILDYLFNLPVGILTIILNIPLFLIGYRSLGKRFLKRTVIATVCSSVFIDLFSNFNIAFTGDKILNVLYGGVLMGAGLGLIYSRGGTTGGTEIMTKLIKTRYDNLSVGSLNLMINAVVIGIAAVIYRSPESALYAIVIQFASSQVLDGVLSGIDNSCAALIITSKPDVTAKAVMAEIGRGVTALSAVGMYTGSERTTLLCAVRSHEVKFLQKLTSEADENSFMIVLSAREVIGAGFKHFGQRSR